MASVVLDASAVLAVLNAEAGAEIVTAVLHDSLLSIVNYAEVISALVGRGARLDQARGLVMSLDLEIAPFDLALADRTGALRRRTHHLGLSLADRACLALAEKERLPVLTSDRNWKAVGGGIEVRVIR